MRMHKVKKQEKHSPASARGKKSSQSNSIQVWKHQIATAFWQSHQAILTCCADGWLLPSHPGNKAYLGHNPVATCHGTHFPLGSYLLTSTEPSAHCSVTIAACSSLQIWRITFFFFWEGTDFSNLIFSCFRWHPTRTILAFWLRSEQWGCDPPRCWGTSAFVAVRRKQHLKGSTVSQPATLWDVQPGFPRPNLKPQRVSFSLCSVAAEYPICFPQVRSPLPSWTSRIPHLGLTRQRSPLLCMCNLFSG